MRKRPESAGLGLLSAPHLFSFARSEVGASAVEFVLILPIMLLALFAIIKFGIVLNNKVELTGAAQAGARVMAIGRSSQTPYTDATNVFYNAAPNLTKGSTTVTFLVNSVTCNSDQSCQTALATGTGKPVSVSASYPCDLSIMGIQFAPNCSLSTQTAERIE